MLQAAPSLLTAQTASVKPFGHLPPRRLTTPSRLTNTTAPHRDAAQTLQTLAAAAVSSPVTSGSFGRDSLSSRVSAASSKVYLGKKAVVVGAGPAGVTAAMYLAQRGFAVQVYDRRPEPRNDTSDTGRSYTITIIERGMAALQQLGITLPAHSGSKALGTVRHDVSGAVTISPQTGALTFSRAELTQLLINEAKRRYPSAINFVWGTTCTSVDLKDQVAHFAGEAGGDEVKAYDLLVGADGVGSQVRHALAAGLPGYQYQVSDSGREYKVFSGLAGDLEPAAFKGKSGASLHLFTSDDPYTSVTAHRDADGTYSGTFTLRSGHWDGLGTCQQYQDLLASKFKGLPQEWVAGIAEQTFDQPAHSAGKRVKCSQLHGPNAVLLGDAAHAVTPVFGQGANSALESCKVLGDALAAAAGDLTALPGIYDKQRRADAHSLCEIDAKAFSFFSQKGWGEPGFVQLLLHVMVGSVLSKLVPSMYGPKPALLRLGSRVPYSQITAAVERDSVIAVGFMGLLAVGLFAALKAARVFFM